MAEEEKPKIKPWELNWTPKENQAPVKAVEEAPQAPKGKKWPWELDWKKKPPAAPSRGLPAPSKVDVSTEAKMKEAAVIQPNERMPDTRSNQSNIEDIDKEISMTNDPNIQAILQKQRKKYERK